MLKENIVRIYEESFRSNWDVLALADYISKKQFTYGNMATKIARMHLLFSSLGIKQGDKVALIGKNTCNWVITFLGTITYGAVIVPVLQEFNENDMQHIINHSDSVLMFCDDKIWDNLDFDAIPKLRAAIAVEREEVLAERDMPQTKHVKVADVMASLDSEMQKAYPNGFAPSDIKYPNVPNDQMLELNYTSGTTGFSKGVMLTCNNLTGNVVFGIHSGLHWQGSRCLSFLPLAHAYGCAFDMLFPLAIGSTVTLLGKIPSPKILLKAMAEVKPHLVICVPLILEKIYRKQIVPMISKGMIRWALAVPKLDAKVYATIRDKLVESFGGCFEEVIVGGAPLNAEVEDFLTKINFPFTVGYGMTECAPLISYTPWREFTPHSSGRVLPNFMECRIDSPDPENIPGEIIVRGEHVMKGYYKNPEATQQVLENNGWLHTGDMGTLSADGTISIRGRSKTMILSANGQNIYPEEIEAKLNNMIYVAESLVVQRDGKLVALVYPDYEAMDSHQLTQDQMPEAMEEIRKSLNKLVGSYEQVSKIELIPTEFERTPKRSIKRYLYR